MQDIITKYKAERIRPKDVNSSELVVVMFSAIGKWHYFEFETIENARKFYNKVQEEVPTSAIIIQQNVGFATREAV